MFWGGENLTDTSNEAFLSVAELLSRVKQHDYTQQDYEILMIAQALARAGRIRSVGRRIGEDGTEFRRMGADPVIRMG